MFTGLVSDIGRVGAVAHRGDTRLTVETVYDTDTIPVGASIACSGACLTVVDLGRASFVVDVSAETVKRTTLSAWRPGRRINLERSLKVGDEIGGHLVSGHVDGVVEVRSRAPEGDSARFLFDLPDWLAPFIATKGSVALDGVSLTVNDVDADWFSVNLIPHTLEVTTFGDAQPGTRVNVEADMLARYVRRNLDLPAAGGEAKW